MTKRAEELAFKAYENAQNSDPRLAIISALTEYGAEVRRRDAEVAGCYAEDVEPLRIPLRIAAAILRGELP